MLFNSVSFALFFPVVTLLYFGLPHRFRWAMLLGASAVFYMAFIPKYILILVFTILMDYVAGLAIERSMGRARAWWLGASIAANVGVLAFFKYFNFLGDNLATFTHAMGWSWAPARLEIILPLGLSFHTFQSMSYTIEVYRGTQPAERHLGIFSLYVLFYPQLVAGPIERPQNLLPQFREHHTFDYERASDGLRLMAWGFFKKILIADRLAMLAEPVFNEPGRYQGLPLLVGMLAFSVQIYCDFSGYSDIARGAARVMGFRLMLNFDRPYLAASIPEFWRRWHISLSTWFRDYVYFPLGGNRVPPWRQHVNVAAVFLLSGLWHGANWTFVVWGALHALCFIVARAAGARQTPPDPRPLRLLKVASTFLLVTLAWVFFRSRSFGDAWQMLSHLHRGWASTREVPFAGYGVQLRLAAFVTAILFAVEACQQGAEPTALVAWRRPWVRWTVYYAVVLLTLSLGVFAESPFIYFQF
jgi:D-alanyl-lipoteichoic acid acyltransferase DltB (MBOAT superfamily)